MSNPIHIIVHGTQGGCLGDSDLAALSAAFEIADTTDAQVHAVAVGNDSASLCEAALDRGCDQALAIETGASLDFVGKASLVGALLLDQHSSWILCGEHQPDDTGSGVAAAIAQLLDLPHRGSVLSALPIEGGLCVARATERGTESSEATTCTVLAFKARQSHLERQRRETASVRQMPASELSDVRFDVTHREAFAERYDWTTVRTEVISDPAELLIRLRADDLWHP